MGRPVDIRMQRGRRPNTRLTSPRSRRLQIVGGGSGGGSRMIKDWERRVLSSVTAAIQHRASERDGRLVYQRARLGYAHHFKTLHSTGGRL